MINHLRQSIFVHIPKTGGTSISDALNEMKDRGHHTLNELIQKEMSGDKHGRHNRDELMGYLKFAFVRNPWDRMVSLYFEKQQSNWLNPGISFDEFIRNVYTEPENISKDPNLLRHAQPCSHWITSHGEMLVNFAGRFENLKNDFDLICNELGIGRKPLKWLRHRKREHYSKYYTQEAMAIVFKYNKEDIERFSYEFVANKT